jgi:hypothetical protein
MLGNGGMGAVGRIVPLGGDELGTTTAKHGEDWPSGGRHCFPVLVNLTLWDVQRSGSGTLGKNPQIADRHVWRLSQGKRCRQSSDSGSRSRFPDEPDAQHEALKSQPASKL